MGPSLYPTKEGDDSSKLSRELPREVNESSEMKWMTHLVDKARQGLSPY